MAKTAEFHTLLRNYRGIMGNIRIMQMTTRFSLILQGRRVLLRFHLSFPTIKLMKRICLRML